MIEQNTRVALAEHTTLRVGGPASRMIVASTEGDLIDLVRDLDAAGEPLLILGSGSNVLIGDQGFEGTVIKVATRGIDEDVAACSGAVITVAAGEVWDDLVAYAVDHEWSGLEAMSGIPGLVGATPIQNVGAYGAEVSQLISTVRTVHRATGQRKTFFPVECGFGYRSSRFKTEPGRYVVTSVTFQLRLGSMSAPIRYRELARTLDVAVGDRAPAFAVREAVLALRRSKGMVLDVDDHDTWSAGSFFTNPIIDAAAAESTAGQCPAVPAARRAGQDQRRLVDRRRRLRQGLRPRAGSIFQQAHARADQSWIGAGERSAGAGDGDPPRAGGSALNWCPSRS